MINYWCYFPKSIFKLVKNSFVLFFPPLYNFVWVIQKNWILKNINFIVIFSKVNFLSPYKIGGHFTSTFSGNPYWVIFEFASVYIFCWTFSLLNSYLYEIFTTFPPLFPHSPNNSSLKLLNFVLPVLLCISVRIFLSNWIQIIKSLFLCFMN